MDGLGPPGTSAPGALTRSRTAMIDRCGVQRSRGQALRSADRHNVTEWVLHRFDRPAASASR
ncbi:hypothetical protein HBB16_11535 [Pseudonocardia sp. MCCB 268]|nr:hypothetical protein [Pseudonocardia cytotoxica]